MGGYATDFHAEDVAINLWLNHYKDTVPATGTVSLWVAYPIIVVYGVRARDKRPDGSFPEPGQVWPCGSNGSKHPCCQEVLDRMTIDLRVKVNPPRSPTPELQLPQYPSDWPRGGR
ncbi:hypothetical protein C8A05DRAFT_33017 [Staphylotrichum tortipilum]|uniref:Uncharacterized protein n=1 Tax=Staphylotrichum tortipilum TaxID=2831512 RepID=A0AAN6MN25_9PEZI|nr:hypothetical protein C8A05DRAFT_33017 [Staphylotrichum longicolle]